MFNNPEHLEVFFTQKRLSTFFNEITLQEDNVEFADVSFSERIQKAVEEQVNFDSDALILRLQKAAKLRFPDAHLSDFSGDNSQNLSVEKINNIATLGWMKYGQNLGLTGKAGTGKTRLGCAIANEAILHGHSVLFYRYSELLRDMEIKEREGLEKLKLFLKKLCRVKVLVIDDWGLSPLTNNQRQLLFELIDLRAEKSSLILTSQYQKDVWYDVFKRDCTTDALMDRIYHCTTEVALEGDNFRRKNAKGDS